MCLDKLIRSDMMKRNDAINVINGDLLVSDFRVRYGISNKSISLYLNFYRGN